MKKRYKKHHKFGLSKVERYQMQIKALQEEINKLRRKQQVDTPESRAKYLTEKDELVVKLKNRVLDLEKRSGNKVYQILCSQHGFNFSYTDQCPDCEEEKNAKDKKAGIRKPE